MPNRKSRNVDGRCGTNGGGTVNSEPVIPCYGCGGYYEESQMEAIDVSGDGEYYPRFIHVCHGCNNPDVDTEGVKS